MLDCIHNNPENRRIVIILQFGQINVWRDRPSVNTYFTSSKLFINSDIDEITNFNKSLDGDDHPHSSTNTFSLIPSNQTSAYDDFMVQNNLKGIAEVWEPVEACTNYFGKADESDAHQTKSYECHNKNCTKTTTSVVPRFMIPIRVQDNTGTITLTMFEREGRYLLKQSCKEFHGDDFGLYPREINALKGLKLAFKFSVTKFNVSNKNNQYDIARISDDETLIEELENKFTESQPSNSQSLDFDSVDLQSQEIKNLKDAVSGTEDNITPSTTDKNDTTSSMKILNTTPVLKQNLEEVFDLELNDHLSTSKAPKISTDGLAKQLLSVKLETNG
uniref:Replication factor A C-terminal domain-containing protein n=1 Tax=Lactuca sativa TaxID=4236 RepID=A0A9R1WID3_LACSA|nr:hypothetical protein LSAT_V11C200070620 [Lactuca sativa]